jgi:hypothetical protein
MTTLQNYVTQVQRLVHDASNANFSSAELTDYINEAREDISLDMHCVRTFYTGVQLPPGQEVYSIQGAVVGANVTAGGNYAIAPSVTFSPAPPGGTTAAGTAVLTGNAVTAINMTTWGGGYLTAPTISFNPLGAAATPIAFTNVFQVISVSNIWNSERYMLSFRGFTLFQAYFRSWTTNFQSRPGVWTIHPQMLQVYLRPPPDQLYISEWDVLSLPTPLVNLLDLDSQVMPPWNKAVQFRAAALALMKNQNFEQAQYYETKYDQRVPKYIIGAGGIRIPNPYNRSFQRRVARG